MSHYLNGCDVLVGATAPIDPYAPSKRGSPIDPYASAPAKRGSLIDPYAVTRGAPIDPYAPSKRGSPIDPYPTPAPIKFVKVDVAPNTASLTPEQVANQALADVRAASPGVTFTPTGAAVTAEPASIKFVKVNIEPPTNAPAPLPAQPGAPVLSKMTPISTNVALGVGLGAVALGVLLYSMKTRSP